MQKEKTIKKKWAPAMLILAASLFSASVLISSCNSGKKDKDETDKTVSTPVPAFLAGKAQYAVLKLTKADLLTLFGPNQVKKLLIEFCDSNLVSSPDKTINAIAYAATIPNHIVGNPVYLFPANPVAPQKWDTAGHQILGNNELSRGDVKIALGSVADITPATAKNLFFYPIKLSNNHIAYFVSKDSVGFTLYKEGIQILTTYPAVGAGSNPSPPAPPCAMCD